MFERASNQNAASIVATNTALIADINTASNRNASAIIATNALLIADSGNSKLRLLALSSNTISTLVGLGPAEASAGDGGPPARAALVKPTAVAGSPVTGDVFVGDVGGSSGAGGLCVRRARFGGAAQIGINASGVIDTVVGTCASPPAGLPYPVALSTHAATAPLGPNGASSIAFDSTGTLYVVDCKARVGLVGWAQCVLCKCE